jgi:hypothetical protein
MQIYEYLKVFRHILRQKLQDTSNLVLSNFTPTGDK